MTKQLLKASSDAARQEAIAKLITAAEEAGVSTK